MVKANENTIMIGAGQGDCATPEKNNSSALSENFCGKNAVKVTAPFEPLVPLRRITVSIRFYELVFTHFPNAEKNPAYRNLLWYLFWGTYLDEDTKRLLLCREILARLAGEPLLNFEAGKFLRKFDIEVLGGHRLICTPADWENGKCRQLIEFKLGEFREIFEREKWREWHKEGRVYLNGQKFSPGTAKKVRRGERIAKEQLKPDCEDARRIQSYLRALPLHLFTENCKKNYSAAVEYVSKTLQEDYQEREFRILKYLDSQPKPFYSATENSVRLFASESIPNLQRDVRGVFTAGWIETDPKCSQLEEVRIRSLLARNLVKNGVNRGYARHFLPIPLIRDVLIAREEALHRVIVDGGAQTCYGKALQIHGELQARDILAQLAQSWEMKLIYPAFALTADNSYCKIMLYQFDGFTAQFTRRPEGWAERIKAAVDARAKEFEIPTSLEWDKEQLDDQELAQMYEELVNSNELVSSKCTLEDYSIINELDDELNA